ncbi:hypothetical protein GLU60_00805 [Nanohaloarchaea archaeon H01]|nr:hypothetical protein [Nanohaloarchaea archaeon H01]
MDAKGSSSYSSASAESLAQPTSQIDSEEVTSDSQELLDKKMYVPGIHESGEEAKGGEVQ